MTVKSRPKRPKAPQINRLKELRNRRGLSQEHAAAMVGYDISTVNRHENGNRGLDGSAIDRYAKLYQVAAYELFVDPETIGLESTYRPRK